MKRDLLLALAAILVVAGISYGLSWARPDLPLSPSKPFAGELSAKKVSPRSPGGKVVMRVNGEPVTETEFVAFMQSVPEQQRAFFANPAGRRALADEIVRVKLLEQEATRLGIDDDPEVESSLRMARSQLVAGRALGKLVKDEIEKQIKVEYEKEKSSSVALRHILIAYEGGQVPARDPKKTPSADQAMKKAAGVVAKLRGGGEFGLLARTESDDQQSAMEGGSLGPVRPEMLPPEVAAVVRKLKPGEISDPVKTSYGVHVFSLTTPTLEDLRPMLAQQVQQKVIAETLTRLQKGAKVDLDPKFFPDDTQPPRPRANG